MSAQEEAPGRKKEFQKRTDEDIDSFLARRDFTKSVPPPPAKVTPEPAPAKPVEAPKKPAEPEEPKEASDEEREEQIRAARTSRADLEAAHDVALLRKKAHAMGHKAAKFYHKYKLNEAKAQKCTAKAVAFREKAGEKKEKAEGFKAQEKEYEAELSGAASGGSDLSPEAIRTKIAHMERKAAKMNEHARKNESKAAAQTEKAAKFKTRAAKFLEQNKLHEVDAKRYAKRADNLERAG